MNSRKIFLIFCSVMSIAFYSGCSSSKSGKDAANKADSMSGKIRNVGEQIPPGIARFKGTIVSIDSSQMKSESPKSPCSKQPCWAKVKVNSVVGYGAGGPVLSVSDTINVKFKFTLGPTTKDLFPHLVKRLPGLQVGSAFQADLHRLSDFKSDNKQRELKYFVYGYKKL